MDCADTHYCTGVGGTCALKLTNGKMCAAGGECMSGNCVDDVCCDKPACGNCEACNLNGVGTCSDLGAGADDPDGTCVDQGPTTCGTNGKCNGSGGCQKYADGTTCSQATCQDAATLKQAGKCAAGTCTPTTKLCAPFVCSMGACTNSCNADGDCADGTYCSGLGGTCLTKKANGDLCNPLAPNQCAFGNCVDGVCCDTACVGACVTCVMPNFVGTCKNVGAGVTDPRAICQDKGVGQCANNGKCDGNGNCQDYAASTMCSDESCTPGTATHNLPGTCATGSCTATTEQCAPYMCGTNNDCLSACTQDTDCVPGYYCNGVACVKQKDIAADCTRDGECGDPANHCVDHVCCGSAKCPQCQSCGLMGTKGTCTSVGKDAKDPTGSCKVTAASSCGTNGLCEDNDDCQYYPGSTSCAPAKCSDTTNQVIAESFCDNNHNCTAGGVATDCGAYNCNPATVACYATCTDGSECVDPTKCDMVQMSCSP
jgi:hypothetical protein